jgi:carboxyl-terminal processing protease
MKKIIPFPLLMVILFSFNNCCHGGYLKKNAENSVFKKSPDKSDNKPNNKSEDPLQVDEDVLPSARDSDTDKYFVEIPESLRNNIPEDMQHIVLLQLIFNLIKEEYVSELPERKIVEKAIVGLLSSLDPHSSYLNEKTFAFLKNETDGEFGGIGIEITGDESFIRIISPVDDTPAYKAGLKSGDIIVYINDECVSGLSIEEAISKLRGPAHTKVKLKIKRADKPLFDVKIERDIIKVQSVKPEILDKIGYIRISSFDKNTADSIKQFLKDNKDKQLSGLVLDLRNNPGGLLDAAIDVSNIFLDGGKIVSTRGRTKENSKSYFAGVGDLSNGMPLVVLINSGTASAPEILAGALQGNKRAIIVGNRSFGKGSVQKIIPLSEKIAIKLTVAKYFTPSGGCIQANGIVPDIEADYAMIQKPEYTFAIREEMLNNALDADNKAKNKKMTEEQNKKFLDALSNKKDNKNKEKESEEDYELQYRKLSLKERLDKDYQLAKAFDTLKVIAAFEVSRSDEFKNKTKSMVLKNEKK